jgi:hypothetical protein
LKRKITIFYPVNPDVANGYESVKGVNPNEEFKKWHTSNRLKKLLFASSALFILWLFFVFPRAEKIDFNKKLEEVFIYMGPGVALFIAMIFLSIWYFERIKSKKAAHKVMVDFALVYDRFISLLGITDDDVRASSIEKLRDQCLFILVRERERVEQGKTAWAKLTRLRKFASVYERMAALGFKFDSVDTYILVVKEKAKAKPAA